MATRCRQGGPDRHPVVVASGSRPSADTPTTIATGARPLMPTILAHRTRVHRVIRQLPGQRHWRRTTIHSARRHDHVLFRVVITTLNARDHERGPARARAATNLHTPC